MSKWNEDIAKIVADPLNVPMPTEMLIRCDMTLEFIKVMNKDNMGPLVTFMLRDGFDPQYRLLAVLEAVRRDTSLADTPAFLDWANNDHQLLWPNGTFV
jgi:hypothetical protein